MKKSQHGLKKGHLDLKYSLTEEWETAVIISALVQLSVQPACQHFFTFSPDSP